MNFLIDFMVDFNRVQQQIVTYYQAGFSVLFMVFILMGLGFFMLTHSYSYLFLLQKAQVEQMQWLDASNRAQSALSLARVLVWTNPNESWSCQRQFVGDFLPCIKLIDDKKALLRGEAFVGVEGDRMVLYVLSDYVNHQQTFYLEPQHQQWLDYCPLKNELLCE